jgi:hypothetical protein
MQKEKFFASRKEDISRSAVDFFSIGHVFMGQSFFWIPYMLFVWASAPFPGIFPPSVGIFNTEEGMILISIIIGVLWEPFENIIMYYAGWKFEGKRDSLLNALFDILFWALGAAIAYFIDNWWLNLIIVVSEIVLWFLIRWIFLNFL